MATSIRMTYRDEQCECCGYPFDLGDEVIDISDEGGPFACSHHCLELISDRILQKDIREHLAQFQSLAL